MSTKTGYINARVEPKLKSQADKVLKMVGVNTSDAITMFLKQVVAQHGIPFEVKIPNAETRRAIAELERGGGHRAETADEMFEDILGKNWRKFVGRGK